MEMEAQQAGKRGTSYEKAVRLEKRRGVEMRASEVAL